MLFGLCVTYLLIITNIKSRSGIIKSINDVVSFASAKIERTHIRKPYIDFPAEPVIIFCGGRAKIKKIVIPPVINMLKVEEKRILNLVEIMKIKRNIIIELPSIIPGEPAVHL